MEESMMVKINREHDEGNKPAAHGVSVKRLVMLGGNKVEQPFTSSGIMREIRYWLIKLLVGNIVVVLNAELKVDKAEDDTCLICATGFVNGSLVENNTFLVKDDEWMLIGSRT